MTAKKTGRPPTGETEHMTFRIPSEIRKPAQRIAALRGETLTAVVKRGLQRYIEDNTALLMDDPYSQHSGDTNR